MKYTDRHPLDTVAEVVDAMESAGKVAKTARVRTRRNYDKLRTDCIQYCKIKIEVLESLEVAHQPNVAYVKDQAIEAAVRAYKDVVARLEGTKGA